MNKKNNVIIAGIIILAIVLTVYGIGFSEGLEITIFVILGILSIIAIWIGFNSGLESDRKLIGIGFLGLAIAIGLVVWNDSNNSSRSRKDLEARLESAKAKWAEQERIDSIQQIEDSIKHYKDSIFIANESKKLYEKEGDTIFGKFLFGMSKKDFDNLKSRIEKETHGVISISGYDFKIDDYKFYNNKMYSLTIKTTNSWTRYYYHDAHEYEENNDGSDIVSKIKESFSNKYGSPHNSFGNWYFNHKHISVGAKSYYSSREGLLSTESWAVFITFKDPVTEDNVDKAEQVKRKKAEEEWRRREEEFQKKKESYGGGL